MENPEKTDLAYRLCESGKFQDALKLFKELVRDSIDPAQKAGYLIDAATCHAENGDADDVSAAVIEARKLVSSDPLALAQIDFFQAMLLVENDRCEEGERALARIVAENPVLLNSGEGRELYEKVQIQRGFTLMNLSKPAEARPLLEEASSFHLQDDVRSSVHCHLGRYYHELRMYALAKEQFVLAQKLKVPEDWEGAFHYYYGYTLYELKEFDPARREFILSLQSGSSGPPASYKYNMLAATHRKLGEYSQARRYEDMAKLKEPL